MKRILFSLILALFLALPAVAQVVEDPSTGASISSGSTISGCNAITAILNVVTGALTCNPASVVNGTVSTAGRSILTIRDTITGASTTSNFLNITGSMPSTLSANSAAVLVDTTVDNDAFIQYGIRSAPSGTGPGSGAVVGVGGDNSETSSGYSYGTRGTVSGAVSTAIGATGLVYGGTNRIGGYFALANQNPPATSGALIIDNAAQAANIFEARDNGTAVFTIGDGGPVTATNYIQANGGFFSGNNNFYVPGTTGVNTNGGYGYITALTPDATILGVGNVSNSVHFEEAQDNSFDFQNGCTTGLGTAACTDPTFEIHSHNQDTGEFLSLAHDGKAGVIAGGNSTVLDGLIRLGGTVTLTESTATTVLTIPIPVTTGSGGFINYVVDARDATNVQIRTGNVSFAVANNSGGTETCNVFGIGPTTQAAGGNTTNPANPTEVQDGSGTGAITSGTLTYTWSVDTTGTNSCVLKLNAVSSLTQTTLQVHYTVISTGPAIVTGG